MDGKRNLSPGSIDKFAHALKLKKDETLYFRALVLLNQAASLDEKKFYADQLIRSRFYKKLHPLGPAQYEYYSHWYLVPIRELVDTKNFQEDPEWIARALKPSITVNEVRHALETLLKLGLLIRNDKGRLVQARGVLSTGDEVTSALVAQFQKEMIQKGAEAINRFPAPERDISSLTLSLSPKARENVKELIQRFRKELLAVAQDDQDQEGVFQVNFQFFPLTGADGGKKE